MRRGYYYGPQGLGYYRSPVDKIKSIVIVTILIIAMILAIYWYIRKKANDDSKDELPSEYADETFTDVEGKKIRSYAQQIVEDLDGLAVYHNKDLYEAVLRESDRIVAGVAVDYKRLTGNSLRQDLNDETSFAFTAPQKELRKKFIARLALLNIF